nr:NUDIX hydrolase [Paenibacillus sp. J31TS4]
MRKRESWHRHFGAYGICAEEEKLLVIEKGNGPYIGRYDLPGGTVEADESLIQTIEREFLEETGLQVEVKRNIGVCDYLIPYELPQRGTSHIHHVAVFYSVHPLPGMTIKPPHVFERQDSLGARWVSIYDLQEENASPLVVQAVEWLKTGQLSLETKRLDDWTVLEKRGR